MPLHRSRSPFPTLGLLAALLTASGFVAAQPSMRSTQEGVYTEAQAAEGKQLFAMACQNCHTLLAHTGPPFRNKWFGQSLGDLFDYLRESMPKADPGSLSDDEYLVALAYLMKINGMPVGTTPLAADGQVLHRIRIDSIRPAPTTSGPRR